MNGALPVTRPPYLRAGDTVAIVCPAKKLVTPMDDAVQLLQSWGLTVLLGETVTASYNQFAGNDALRAADLQSFINDSNVKAIIAARGGYGTIRIIDLIDFTPLLKNPKWLVGFSDITLLHTHLFANCNLQTIHGQMPVNIPDATLPSLESLRKALFGGELIYNIPCNPLNRKGEATGILIGGNLSLLVAASGSVSDPDYTDKILFIEDVGEYFYAIDRMLYSLKRSGKLSKLSGLIVGGFTDIKDNDIPFGQTVEEIIMAVVSEYSYPVCFDFPAGHIKNNFSLVLGSKVNLNVTKTQVNVTLSLGFKHGNLSIIITKSKK